MSLSDAVMADDGLVLLKFHAVWCFPCKAMAPELDKALRKFPGVTLKGVNVDDSPDQTAAHGVRSIPTLVLVKAGTPDRKSVV